MSIIAADENLEIVRTSRGRLVLRRFLRNRIALVGIVVIVVLYVAAFTYGWYWAWSYQVSDPNAYLAPPSGTHLFGTDKDGFDMYAQVMRGLQKSLTIGLLVAVLSTGTAAVVGSVAGYFRGVSDRALMWLVDLLLTLPNFLIIAVLSPAFKGRSWLLFVLLLAAFSWMITARIVRGMTLSVKEQDFVRAARLMGVPPLTGDHPAHPAADVVAADRGRDDQRGHRDPDRDVVELLRVRRAAAGRVTGHADRRPARRRW